MHRPTALALISRRRWLQAAGGALALAAAGCGVPPTSQPARPGSRPALRLIGEATLAHRLRFEGTVVGGLSGLDYQPATGLWVALADDRSELSPARFYTLRMDVAASRLGTPELVSVVTLRQPDGTAFPGPPGPGDIPDPESIRWLPNGNLLWTSEGDVRRGLSPALRECTPEGRHVRSFTLPDHLMVGPTGRGPRNNLTLEGLTLTPDGRFAWAAMEGALQQDGPEPTVAAPGGPCRFTQFNLATGAAVRQITYIPDPIPAAPLVPGMADNGVSEVLMADEHHMLVLERAYMPGRGLSLRLYRIDTRTGSDTLAQAQLSPGAYTPAPKTLVADFSNLGLSRLDNTEGMAWGPRLANGSRTLVFVSDDNFNPLQVTQFVACEYLD